MSDSIVPDGRLPVNLPTFTNPDGDAALIHAHAAIAGLGMVELAVVILELTNDADRTDERATRLRLCALRMAGLALGATV
jgi:hypothetical protein